MRESEFIDYIAKKFHTKKPIVRGIGDDAAVMDYAPGKYLLFATDMIAEGVHFTAKATPFEIGWKAMAVNISDIAAMGGIPKYALISVGIPRTKDAKFLKEITRGIEKISKKFGIDIIGGDTNRSGKTVINVTLIGEVEKKYLVTRFGAKPGDLIFVTGALGEGKAKHLKFLPRVKVARILVKNFKINSMIDLSDGLQMDLNRLAAASKVGSSVYKSLIPLSDKSLPLERAISSGEDFELLFTASIKESKRIIKRMGKKDDLPVTLIGEVCKRSFGVRLVEESGKARVLKPKGFRHL